MQHGAVLRDVDPLAGEHRVAAWLELARSRQGEEQLEGPVVDQLLGVVEVDPEGLEAEPPPTLGVGGEELAQLRTSEVVATSDERLPLGALGERAHLVSLPQRSARPRG